jgi:endonuclease/exonuclease/phosphatase (EEP) superfamily protein YafD
VYVQQEAPLPPPVLSSVGTQKNDAEAEAVAKALAAAQKQAVADARTIEVGQEEKKMILQQLEAQVAQLNAQGGRVLEIQQQLQQQRDVTAKEVAAHAATSRDRETLEQQV